MACEAEDASTVDIFLHIAFVSLLNVESHLLCRLAEQGDEILIRKRGLLRAPACENVTVAYRRYRYLIIRTFRNLSPLHHSARRRRLAARSSLRLLLLLLPLRFFYILICPPTTTRGIDLWLRTAPVHPVTQEKDYRCHKSDALVAIGGKRFMRLFCVEWGN